MALASLHDTSLRQTPYREWPRGTQTSVACGHLIMLYDLENSTAGAETI